LARCPRPVRVLNHYRRLRDHHSLLPFYFLLSLLVGRALPAGNLVEFSSYYLAAPLAGGRTRTRAILARTGFGVYGRALVSGYKSNRIS
jgi:hypothetical protein